MECPVDGIKTQAAGAKQISNDYHWNKADQSPDRNDIKKYRKGDTYSDYRADNLVFAPDIRFNRSTYTVEY
jgi:hypothetical protein